MAHLLVRQQVEDFARWKAAFDDDAAVRDPAGSRGGFVFQNAADPNEVIVLIEWESLEHLQAFTQSDELRQRMQRAGVTGAPEILYLELADVPTV